MKIQKEYRSAEEAVRVLLQLAHGRIFFGTPTNPQDSNCAVDPAVSLVVSSANTDTTASHGLGRVPECYVVVGQTAAGSVYDSSAGTVNWDSDTIELRASATGTYRLMIW